MTPRRWMALGALLAVTGLMIAGTAPVVGTSAARAAAQAPVGGAFLVAGWALLAWSIHSFGRRG